MRRPACVDARARDGEHRRALVDADRALGERGEQFEHAAGAGAEVEQRVKRRVADEREDRRLDALLGRMQGADAVPVGGALGEIGGGLLAPRLARDFEPRAVGCSVGSSGARRPMRSRASAPPASASRKNAQAPSRWRSASPASTSSLRWRETRGCDWPRMATSSLTVSSASQSRPSSRSRVTSPAASSAVEQGVEAEASGETAWREL